MQCAWVEVPLLLLVCPLLIPRCAVLCRSLNIPNCTYPDGTYPAQRVSATENEGDAVKWTDNSCFPRFNDISTFQNYLVTGVAPKFNSASGLAASLATIMAGVMLVLGLLYQ